MSFENYRGGGGGGGGGRRKPPLPLILQKYEYASNEILDNFLLANMKNQNENFLSASVPKM